MQNIEIKARCPDLERARQTAEKLSARFEKTYHQIDTYFTVKQGRLKLREFDEDLSQLIYYERPDLSQTKLSQYDIHEVPDPSRLKAMLSAALGVWTIVEKHRDVYWYEEVRVHLDRVRNLGTFIEFEGVVSDSSETSRIREKVEWLRHKFIVDKSVLVEVSYSDLMQKPSKLPAT